MIVVDASVIVDVVLRKRDSIELERRMLADGEILVCPHLLDVEVAQALRRQTLNGAMDDERGLQALSDYEDLPLMRFPHEPLLTRVWELRNNFTAYDAVYVALAEALGIPLLTRDKGVARSPGHAATIELI